MTVRQPPFAVGRTHASSVMPDVRSSELESGMLTLLDVPLNERAEPNLPAADHVAFTSVPLLADPDLSAAVVPAPSSKLYAATRPAGGGAPPLLTVTFTAVEVVVLPVGSRLMAVIACVPFVAVVESQVMLKGALRSSLPTGAPSTRNFTP